MANGQLIQGKQVAGVTQTASGDVVICGWTMPINTTARVEAHCVVQQVDNDTIKNSFTLSATVRRDTGGASVSDGPTIREEEGVTAMDITIVADGNDINVETVSDGNEYRVSTFLDIYTVEQTVIVA
jgi:hypothetical protein